VYDVCVYFHNLSNVNLHILLAPLEVVHVFQEVAVEVRLLVVQVVVEVRLLLLLAEAVVELIVRLHLVVEEEQHLVQEVVGVLLYLQVLEVDPYVLQVMEVLFQVVLLKY